MFDGLEQVVEGSAGGALTAQSWMHSFGMAAYVAAIEGRAMERAKRILELVKLVLEIWRIIPFV